MPEIQTGEPPVIDRVRRAVSPPIVNVNITLKTVRVFCQNMNDPTAPFQFIHPGGIQHNGCFSADRNDLDYLIIVAREAQRVSRDYPAGGKS